MPRGDRTGPMGAGPNTGRGLGYCNGSNQPGFMSGAGAGMGRGFGGRRRGQGRGFLGDVQGAGLWNILSNIANFATRQPIANPQYYQQTSPQQPETDLILQELSKINERITQLEEQINEKNEENKEAKNK